MVIFQHPLKSSNKQSHIVIHFYSAQACPQLMMASQNQAQLGMLMSDLKKLHAQNYCRCMQTSKEGD